MKRVFDDQQNRSGSVVLVPRTEVTELVHGCYGDSTSDDVSFIVNNDIYSPTLEGIMLPFLSSGPSES